MRRSVRILLVLITALPLIFSAGIAGGAGRTGKLRLSEFRVDHDAMCKVRDQWMDQILATHEAGTWAEMKFEATDSQLALMGLPPAKVLASRSYAKPTIVTKDGRFAELSNEQFEAAVEPALAAYGGAGCLGIRPGGWLLLLSGGGIGWCSLAHVYGSPGSYDISTAGHCGKQGDVATAIAAFGNRGGLAGPVLLDFGKFATSRDGGLGNDWALIDVYAQYQHLVTPTMCFWGGPRGMYTKTGGVATVSIPRNRLIPSVTVTPDPLLAQSIAHYGHGTGLGQGVGTPRLGEAIHWGASHFMFFGAISPGDSGSGANTVAGDTVGANMEAAGIMTHLYVDPLMRQGLGIMGGTRATAVNGTLANGQIVPYPAPAPGLP